ncbi:MAG: AAA family ATPase, partial [Actinomycetota bacterium]|nr:AAA family ATPase [Actinomycetota bacterium]
MIARFARNGRTLSGDQAAALTGILTSGAAVEVIAAPAGTGKSFLIGTLAETWTRTGTPAPGPGEAPTGPGGAPVVPGEHEGPRVFGVAYGQRQADILTEDGVTARNIRAWLDGQTRLDTGAANPTDETFRLRAGDLLVVDEAGAADTASLVAIHRRCQTAGVKLLLVGDPRQIGAVGPGGALVDIAERGITYELAEVRRFANAWEGPASLRLRDGDTSVLGEYAKHGRLVDAGTV